MNRPRPRWPMARTMAPAYRTIAAYGDIEVVTPPRSTAAPSGATGLPTQRDLGTRRRHRSFAGRDLRSRIYRSSSRPKVSRRGAGRFIAVIRCGAAVGPDASAGRSSINRTSRPRPLRQRCRGITSCKATVGAGAASVAGPLAQPRIAAPANTAAPPGNAECGLEIRARRPHLLARQLH